MVMYQQTEELLQIVFKTELQWWLSVGISFPKVQESIN